MFITQQMKGTVYLTKNSLFFGNKKGNQMIKLDNISYSFPQKDLYNKISFTLEDNQHCAFIGTSGTGKSTLIDIIMNSDKYMFDGKLEMASDCRVGYVSQFSQIDQEKEITTFEYVAEEFTKLQQEITAACAEMENTLDMDLSLDKYQQVMDAWNAIDGDNFESNIMKKLNLANLNSQKDMVVSKLSGGEFKLIQVIKAMLAIPDLMIMDEPDVFLDFENLNALRDLINSYKGTMLVITHNRYLLNHCFNKIIHLENTELQEFNGRYIDYQFSLLQRKIELQELAHADTEEIERNKKMINDMRHEATYFVSAAKGKTLNARVSLLQRLESARIKTPFVDIKQPEIHLTSKERTEETIILKVSDYSVSFEDLLLEHVNFEMKATDKVALVGPNGTGKTTLFREIVKNESSSIQIKEDADVVFLSQILGDTLNESNSIEDEFFDAGFRSYDEIKAYLSDYGFEGEFLKQKIGALSGGERNLLQLAKISASKADLLLLDEPTSHLDTYSQIALEKAISNYKGAVLMISHDFYTIVNCMDYVILIDDKTIRRMSMRSFRKMIYANHFDKDYLEIEQKKNIVERKIEMALKVADFENAKILSEELEVMIKMLN